jgi:multisubunit Na+/H+ antiporter MnhC subunit
LLAFAGEVKNLQHGLVDESDRMEEREASPVTKAFVLTTFCVG